MARATIKDFAKRADELMAQRDELMAQRDEFRARYQEATAENGRLKDRLSERTAKIKTLQNVARFYRGQRDRVDGYLSGVLDMIARFGVSGERPADTMPAPVDTLRDVVRDAERLIDRQQQPSRQSDRPRVQEPFVRDDFDDGRKVYQSYREAEPPPDWESW